MQKKPQPPTLKAQLKLQKPGNPIRPIINNIQNCQTHNQQTKCIVMTQQSL